MSARTKLKYEARGIILLDMIYLVLSGLILFASATTTNLGTNVYNLHQALNYLGLVATGTCPQAQSLARTHLEKIRGGDFQGTTFQDLYGAIRAAHQRDPIKIPSQEFESLRLRLSDSLRAASIDHDLRWHREIREQCPRSAKIE